MALAVSWAAAVTLTIGIPAVALSCVAAMAAAVALELPASITPFCPREMSVDASLSSGKSSELPAHSQPSISQPSRVKT